MRLSALAAAAGVALAIATGFLCAALFVLIYRDHGAIIACLAGAALFGGNAVAAVLWLTLGVAAALANRVSTRRDGAAPRTAS